MLLSKRLQIYETTCVEKQQEEFNLLLFGHLVGCGIRMSKNGGVLCNIHIYPTQTQFEERLSTKFIHTYICYALLDECGGWVDEM